jgi:hypothetical protein
MKLFPAIFLALTLQAALPAMTMAGGLSFSYGTEEKLTLIGQTSVQSPDGAPLALCHYTSTYRIFTLGIWTKVLGYALSDTNCTSNAYYEISDQDFANARTRGQIDSGVPLTARLGFGEILDGFGGLIILVLAGLLLAAYKIGAARRIASRKAALRATTDGLPGDVKQFLDAMCHAALAGGPASNAQITLIADIIGQLTGAPFATARVQTVVDAATSNPDRAVFSRLGAGLSPEDQELLVKAVVSVISVGENSDPSRNISAAGDKFNKNVIARLDLEPATVKAAIAAVLAHPA